MFILKKGHQPGVYVPLRALFLVYHPKLYTMVHLHIYKHFLVHKGFHSISIPSTSYDRVSYYHMI